MQHSSHILTQKSRLRDHQCKPHRNTRFFLTMMISKHCSTQGFIINNDITQSPCLTHYHHILSTIATLSCSSKCAHDEVITHFENNKQHYNDIISGQIYTTMHEENPEHLHLLPSILSPQISYPLIEIDSKTGHLTLQCNRNKGSNPIINQHTHMQMHSIADTSVSCWPMKLFETHGQQYYNQL
jgi:hypothetical protein